MKVLMVCLGNICRSPMAQGILEKKIRERGLDIEVDSAGTSDYHIDEEPDERAIRKSREYDIDITAYRGRQISLEDFDEYDVIFAMDESNYTNIIALTEEEEKRNKVKMMLNESEAGANMSVPDPYFGGEEGFENVYRLLDRACDKFLDRIEQES
jgi:protein-tyrosine phosphatase